MEVNIINPMKKMLITSPVEYIHVLTINVRKSSTWSPDSLDTKSSTQVKDLTLAIMKIVYRVSTKNRTSIDTKKFIKTKSLSYVTNAASHSQPQQI